MFGDVGECLLGHPIERNPGLGAEVVGLTGDDKPAGDATVLLELLGQSGEPIGARQLLVAEHADGPASLLEAGLS